MATSIHISRPLPLSLLATVAVVCQASMAWAWSPLTHRSDPVRGEIRKTEEELRGLPLSPVHISPWTLGYCSSQEDDPAQPVTVEIRLPKTEAIDLVVLMPSTFTDGRSQLAAFGFPVRFKLELILADGTTSLIADHSGKPYPLPGIEPQLFPCADALPTAGLRITVTERAANPTWWKASHVFALSEVYAFAGGRNAALGAEVSASSTFDFSYIWHPRCLTDGFCLFSPINHQPTNPLDEFEVFGLGTVLEMDLGQPRSVDEVRFWPVIYAVQHEFAPAAGITFPQAFKVELAQAPDFSDARIIAAADPLTQRPGMGPLMMRTNGQPGRYVRISLSDGLRDYRREDFRVVGLGEIQLLENGHVVSDGITARAVESPNRVKRVERLTDGRTNAGIILPLRQWLTQFKRRVDLENRLAFLRLDLERARRDEDRDMAVVLLVAAGLILLLLQAIWLVKARARKRWASIRERIACDLHDEIGANVSSLAHTAELLDESIGAPSETQKRLLDNLIGNARLTARETKHFIRFIDGENQDRDFGEQLGQVTAQILGTLSAKLSLESPRSFNSLDPSTKWNLLLFCKEALNNIIKHAAASNVEIRAWRAGSRLFVRIADDGRGMPPEKPECRHLASRAKILGGQFDVADRPGGGTSVTLCFDKDPAP